MQTPGTASVAWDGGAWTPLNGPGDVARDEDAGLHVVRNVGPATVELVEIEVRGALPRRTRP